MNCDVFDLKRNCLNHAMQKGYSPTGFDTAVAYDLLDHYYHQKKTSSSLINVKT